MLYCENNKYDVKVTIRNICVCVYAFAATSKHTKPQLILQRLWGFSLFSLFKDKAPSKESLRVEAAHLRLLSVVREHTRV